MHSSPDFLSMQVDFLGSAAVVVFSEVPKLPESVAPKRVHRAILRQER